MAGGTADELVDGLRRRGVRITAPRRAVLDALVAAGSHVTAEALHVRVQALHPDISTSSIYRTMDLLTELGIATHVHVGHGPAQFHLAKDEHAHLACNGCGAVVQVDDALTQPFARTIEQRFGFALDLGHFALTGWCRDCEDGRP